MYSTFYAYVLHSINGGNSGEDRQKEETVTTTYLYIGNSTRYSKVTETVSVTGLPSKTTVTDYLWDIKGNMVKAIDSLGRFTSYTYDPQADGFNMLIEKIEYIPTRESTYITTEEGIVTTYTLDGTGRNVVASKEQYVTNVKTNVRTITYNAPLKTIPTSNQDAYIWSPAGLITHMTFKIYWKTKGWSSNNDSRYMIDYRLKGTTVWIKCYDKTNDGGFFSKKGTDTVNITLPSEGEYEIRIRHSEGKTLEVESGSYASGPDYYYDTEYDSAFVYTTYKYDPNNPGNVIATNLYPLGVEVDPFIEDSIGPFETRTTLSYDTVWNLYPVEMTTQVTAVDNVVSIIKTYQQYDALGRITSKKIEEVGKDSSETFYEYDDLGRLIKIINPPLELNGLASYKTVTYYDSQRQSIEKDELANDILSNEYGKRLRNTYDGLGRLIYTEWQSTDGSWHLSSYIEYDSLGRQVAVFDGNFNETRYEYDAFNRKIKTISAYDTMEEESIEHWYMNANASLNVNPSISLIPPSGFNLLEFGGWIKTEDRENNVSYIGYDILGRTIWTALNPRNEAGAPAWEMTWYEYDLFGRITKVAMNRTAIDWDITEYEYYYDGQKTIFSSPLTMKLPGNVEPKYVYKYNARGLRTEEYQVDNPNNKVTYKYDEKARLIQVSYPQKNEYVNMSSDSFSPVLLSGVRRTDNFYHSIYGVKQADSFRNNDLESSISFNYNQRGWLTKETWLIDPTMNESYSFEFTYDTSGNKMSMKYPDDYVINYIYDEVHRLKSIPGYFGDYIQAGFTYDNVSNLIEMNSANGIITAYTYDSFNRATSILSTLLSEKVLSLDYFYTPNGNISKIIDSSDVNSTAYNYTYDAKGQLKTAESEISEYWLGMERVVYFYDGIGNRIQEIWYNSADWMIKQFDYQYSSGSYLMSRGGTESPINGVWLASTKEYIWDTVGQLNVKNNYDHVENTVDTEQYVFNGRKQLTGIIQNNIPTEIYVYDALGRRIKIIDQSTFTLDLQSGNESGYEVKKETTTGNITSTKYISVNGKYLAKVVEHIPYEELPITQTYFHHVDLIGSIRVITNIGGEIVSRSEYEPFGLVTLKQGSDDDNIGFAGKRLDSGSSLSYFGARYYDAEIGRFISRDGVTDGRNWFIYSGNNPLVYIDPNGMKVIFVGLNFNQAAALLRGDLDEEQKLWYLELNIPHLIILFNDIHPEAMKSKTFSAIFWYMHRAEELIYVGVSSTNRNFTHDPEKVKDNFSNVDYFVDITYNKSNDFNFKDPLWVYIEEMCHAYEYLTNGESLRIFEEKGTLAGEIWMYNTYVKPILQEIDPVKYKYLDDPDTPVYEPGDGNIYNANGKIIPR